MASVLHGNQGTGEIHIVYNWSYANATARAAATGFTAGDVGKLALQQDNNTLWLLTAVTPTWQEQVPGNDSRLTDARTPTAHHTTHESGGSDVFTAVVPAPAFSATGLTGTTAGTRLVGATATGAPASGTFVVGDFVVTQDGKIWVCTVAGTPGTWVAAGAGLTDPTTTEGDLLYRTAGAVTRLAVGTAGQRLKSNGTDPAWGDDFATLSFVIDGGGSAITTGVKGDLMVPDDYTIISATLLADQSGSIVVDIFKTTYALYDAGATHPVSADKITASAPPTISAATKGQDTTLTGWTTSLSAGDVLRFNVNSAATVTRVTVALRVKKRS